MNNLDKIIEVEGGNALKSFNKTILTIFEGISLNFFKKLHPKIRKIIKILLAIIF